MSAMETPMSDMADQPSDKVQAAGTPGWAVFLLGRPASGKSVIHGRLVERLHEEAFAGEFPRLDDYPKILAVNAADVENRRHRPAPGGGFLITDETVWDEVLRLLDQDVAAAMQRHAVVFVEFARTSYRDALKNFSAAVLARSFLVYLDCPFDLCWQRNVDRWRKERERGIDAHLTSREEMERTYRQDDGLTIPSWFGPRAFVVDNSTQDLTRLEQHVATIVSVLRQAR